MDSSFFTLFASIFIIGVLVFVAILLTSHKKYAFNKMEYQTDFLAIENSLVRSNTLSYNMAIVDADKLLDKALRESGVQGKTMGERLKKCGKEKFSNLNSVWSAHKIRNQIAHEPRFSVSYEQSKRALGIYRQALKDLGAI